MSAAQLNNYSTASRARVKANKNTSGEEFGQLLDMARAVLKKSDCKSLSANLNGIVVELVTNSQHQYDFWERNWWLSDGKILPHAQVYSVKGVEGLEPSAYYHPQTNTALFINTEYYGQCKSWALGVAAAILEKRFNTLSIHGATASYKGKGVVIIAPTGTGKTTHSFRIFQHEGGKICGDDWAYIRFPEGKPSGPPAPLLARQPEKSLYMRSETQRELKWLREVFDKSLNENVVTTKDGCEYLRGPDCAATGESCVFERGMGWCYYSFGNSRTLVRREDLLGPSKVVDEVPVNLVVLLRRDDHSPPIEVLRPEEAIAVLRKGEYMILPGAGPKEKWGTLSNEPWYNPYLLELDNARQERFFRSMFEAWRVPCIILNTGVEGIEESNRRILSALENA